MTEIPAMTHPLSRYWDQPARDRVLVDDEHAVIARADFEKLAEYSTTYPDGKYVGKMWRRRSGPDDWLLCWYGEADEPDMLTINFRKLLVCE